MLRVLSLLALLSCDTPRTAAAPTTATTAKTQAATPTTAKTQAATPTTATTTTATTTTATTTTAKTQAALQVAAGQLALVGAGDIADCGNDNDDATARLVQAVLDQSPAARAFTLGDNAYPDGTLEQFARCYEPTWGRFKSRTIPVVGNHEYRTPRAAGFRGTFAGRFTADGPLWLSTDVEGTGSDGAPQRWHVIVLDTNCREVGCTPGSPQYTFVENDLRSKAATTADCTVALMHHPRFSSGHHGDDEAVQPLWTALREGGVDLVLAGHDHIYERFAPLDPQGARDDARGLVSLVVGTGGRSHYPALFARAHSVLRVADAYGVLLVLPKKGGATARFVGVDGAVHDEFELRCR
jgi:alkaline phosphatase